MARLNRALNAQQKIWGLKSTGVYLGVTSFVIGFGLFSVLAGIIGSSVGYFFGVVIGDAWHSGSMQKVIYWYLPFKIPFIKAFIPSDKRYFL